MADRDVDRLFRRTARPTRPSPRFEEELLLRLERELDEPDPAHVGADHAVELIPTELVPADTIDIVETHRRRRRPLTLVAATIIVIAGGAALMLLIRDNPSSDIPAPLATAPTEDVVDTSMIVAIDAVCREHLPDLARFFPSADPLPGNPGDDTVELAAPVLRSMIDELRTLIDPVPPALAGPAAELADLDRLLVDQEILLAAGQPDQTRYGLPLIARRIQVVMTDLAASGSSACSSFQSSDE